MIFFRKKLYLVWDLFLLIVWYLLLIVFIIPNYYKVLRSRRLRENNIEKRFHIVKKNRKSYDFKKKQRRYYKCSYVRLGGIDKFFEVLNITARALSKALTKAQLKQIPVEDKKDVMKSLIHPHVEFKGTVIIDNKDYTAFSCLTHAPAHNVMDKNKELVKLDSFLVDQQDDGVYTNVGPEFRFLLNGSFDKEKLYKDKEQFIKEEQNNFLQRKQKIEEVFNKEYSNSNEVLFIKGFDNNFIQKGYITKIETKGQSYYLIKQKNENIKCLNEKTQEFNQENTTDFGDYFREF